MNGGGSTTNGHSELFYMDYIEATTSSAAAAANLPSQRQPRIEQETPPNSAESYSQVSLIGCFCFGSEIIKYCVFVFCV